MALRQVVATVTLVGLGPGDPVWADDEDAQIARWLRGGQLRYVDPQPEVEGGSAKPKPRPKSQTRRVK